jgi:competence protein ComEA
MDELQEKLSQIFTQNKLPTLLGIIGLLLLGYGMISLSSHKDTSEEIQFTSASQNSPASSSVKSARSEINSIVVDVAGGVLKPGVYTLPEDSRIQDAIDAAGGMNEDADKEKVEKVINLASKVSDGSKVYVPKIGEGSTGTTSTTGITSTNTQSNQQININSASEAELDGLPGIGKVTAGKIVNSRPYGKIEDLLDKKVVSNSVFAKIKDQIVAY